ncbi:MAG: C40 family peptidase [Steroidobacteraceae bacterium]
MMCAALLLAGCAAAPRSRPEPGAAAVTVATPGEQIAARALAQLGKPYRYGGNGPDAFDCSGLVRYAYSGIGVDTPRTTADQFRAARTVTRGELAAGDLLFFRIGGAITHVGIYAGDGRFVHAPQTGRAVEIRPIDDSYYRTRLAGIGRLY